MNSFSSFFYERGINKDEITEGKFPTRNMRTFAYITAFNSILFSSLPFAPPKNRRLRLTFLAGPRFSTFFLSYFIPREP